MKNRAGRVLPVWRSLFFVPVTSDKFVDTAHTRGADAIVLDLEDSVAPARKQEARERLAAAAEKVARGGTDIVVRINRSWRHAIPDMEAAVSPRIAGLMLPKVENANHVRVISEVVSELEAERGMTVGSTYLIALVESAEAYPRMEEIANADQRVVAMSLGSEDFTASCGMAPEDDGLYVPKMQMLVLARGAGIIPMGFIGTIADYKDLEGLRRATQRARKLGFMATNCIHPGQIPVVNEAYGPSTAEVDAARRVVAAAAKADTAGLGAVELDGRMIDPPVVDRARGVLERYERIAALEARRRTPGR